MPNKQITAFTEVSTAGQGAEILIQESGNTRKITKGNLFSDLIDPTEDQHPATKVWVETQIDERNTYDTMAALRLVAPVAGAFARTRAYANHTNRFDQGAGTWRAVTGAAGGTFVHNGGTVIVVSGGDGSAAWLRIYEGHVNVKWFGALGDTTTGASGTDDTTAIHACFDYCHFRNLTMYFPAGTYLVTAKYTTSSPGKSFHIYGEGTQAIRTSSIHLSGTTEFIEYADSSYGQFTIRRMGFRVVNYTLDRNFIKFTGLGSVTVEELQFKDVEHPFVFTSSMYLQPFIARDIVFSNSGTFKSVTTGGGPLLTGIVLNNIRHSGSVPECTSKIVCDLRNCRRIDGDAVFLEGSLPSTGWTILRCSTGGAAYTRAKLGHIYNTHMEWSGNAPTYNVHLETGQLYTDIQPGINATPSLVENGASLFQDIETDNEPIADHFDLSDSTSSAILPYLTTRSSGATYKLPGSTVPTDSKIIIRNGLIQATGYVPNQAGVVFGNGGTSVIYEWGGGFFDGETADFEGISGTSYYPESDTTHGRKFNIVIPATVGDLNARFTFPLRGVVAQGQQYNILMKGKMPTLDTGSFTLYARIDSVNVMAICTLASEEEFTLLVPIHVYDAVTTEIGFMFSGSGTAATTASGPIEIYSMVVLLGHDCPRRWYPRYPKTIITYNSAAPTSGTWVVGDIVYNNTPSAGGTLGWICTTAGTPGTWKIFGGTIEA